MSEIRSQATPARDELAETMVDDLFEAENCGELMTWDDNGTPWVNREAIAETLVPKGWSKPRTVNSATELDALPVNTCGVDDGDHYWIRHSENWHCSCDGTDVEWSSENLWEEINLGGPGTFTVLFSPGDAG